MSARAEVMLSRLPAHLDPARPGKQLHGVFAALAQDLDTQSADIAGIRRARRLGHAETVVDLLRLGALHGIDNEDVDVLFLRWARARALLESGDPADLEQVLRMWGVDWAALIVGSPPEEIGPVQWLDAFAACGSPPEDDEAERARARLQLLHALRYRNLTDLLRARIGRIAEIHARGNGTVLALLEGAANALDLEIDRAANAALRAELRATGEDDEILDLPDGLFHSTDRFFHATLAVDRAPLWRQVFARPPQDEDVETPIARRADVVTLSWAEDRMSLRGFALKFGLFPETVLEFAQERLLPPLPDATLRTVVDFVVVAELAQLFGFHVQQALPAEHEVVGLEENPQRREEREAVARHHGELFEVPRRGFGRALLEISVTGIEDLTLGPMVVNRDEGHGVGFVGAVPAGKTVVFREDGRAYLDGEEVTSFTYAWQGGCFADEADLELDRDFLFAGPDVDPDRVARFAVATPANGLDEHAIFPHAGRPIPVPGVSVGLTRMAYFVQQAHFSAAVALIASPPASPPGSPPGAPPELDINRVPPRPAIGFFDGSVFAPPPGPAPDAGLVGLSWMEHEAYAVRVLIPARFQALDEPGEVPVTERVATALERFRPAGVDVRVEYLDETWILGSGYLPGAVESANPLAILRGGTLLSLPPEE